MTPDQGTSNKAFAKAVLEWIYTMLLLVLLVALPAVAILLAGKAIVWVLS